MDCFNLFLSHRNLYQIQNFSKQYVYKKCSSYSFLHLKVSQTNEFYKHYKGNSMNLVNAKITDF